MTSNTELHILNNGDRVFFVQDFDFLIDVPDINSLTDVDMLKYGRFYKIMAVMDRSYMLPQLGFALQRYIKHILLLKQTSQIVEYRVKNTYTKIEYRGLVRPLKPRELNIKPEEQRQFQWLNIDTFSLNGNMTYHLVEDYIRKGYKP